MRRAARGVSRRGALFGSGAFAGAGILSACASPTRLPPVPREATQKASVLGIPNERFFYLTDGETIDAEFRAAGQRQIRPGGFRHGQPLAAMNLLAVSGGGEDGAFGAGLLNGWTEAGTRPVFDLVTGVSTGALTAPFAFLGPAYDPQLKEVYTGITLADVAESRGFVSAIFNDALADTAPLFRTISKHLNEEMLAAIGRGYEEGRLLLVGTTHLDAQRPVVWNVGAIARSGHPGALDLVRRILLASAAVPGAFPPVMIDVTWEGRSYQEMHVDGGAFAQAFLYPPAVGEARLARRRRGERVREAHAWVIRNARLDPNWAETERRTLGIAGRSISTMIFTSGFNDVIRMYNRARIDGVAFHLAFIGADFDRELPAPFDQGFMRALFDYGFARGRAGGGWVDRPPFV